LSNSSDSGSATTSATSIEISSGTPTKVNNAASTATSTVRAAA
jgi:hypothetical protein